MRTSFDGVWCAVPVYNNGSTVRDVVLRCQHQLPNVVVVDDGSDDTDVAMLLDDTGVTVLTHDVNLGKGHALQTAAALIGRAGGSFMVTVDADGQHFPEDIPALLNGADDDAIVVGAREQVVGDMPGRSRFGRAFSDFWVWLETGQTVRDTQSGLRLYPIAHLRKLSLYCGRYDFEIEVLVKAAWAGLTLRSVPVRVWYPPPEGRVSSFRPILDNLRISLAHTRLVGRRLLPWPCRRLVPRRNPFPSPFLHPRSFLRCLLRENATPLGLGTAAAMGVCLGTLPLLGCHTAAILYVAIRFRLNKVMALGIQHLCMPPFVPVFCIALGYRLRHGELITASTLRELASSPGARIWEWLIGSLIAAPLLGLTVGAIVYGLATVVSRRERSESACAGIDG